MFGTRPEAIKLSPVVLAFRADPRFRCHVCLTAQHQQILDYVSDALELTDVPTSTAFSVCTTTVQNARPHQHGVALRA